MAPLIIDTLKAGASVVLDFAGNRVTDRAWVVGLCQKAEAPHILHFLDVDEDECLRRLQMRNTLKPDGLYFASTTEEEFRAICSFFQTPQPDEGLNILAYRP